MRYLFVIAVGLLSFSWAQNSVKALKPQGVLKRNPQIDAAFRNAQWIRFELDGPSRPSLRTAGGFSDNLTWLKPHQDADTVPTTPNTLPNFAQDTLLGNGAGDDIDPSTPSQCNHSHLDSVLSGFAYLIRWSRPGDPTALGNYLLDLPPQGDTTEYLGGGIAERYDIDPGNGRAIVIKGLATHILNNFNTSPRDCDGSTTSEPQSAPFNVADNGYTIMYELWDTTEITFQVDVSDQRPGTLPDTILLQSTKTADQIRIGWSLSSGQCVAQDLAGNRSDRFDYVYFSQPFKIEGCPRSVYAALRYDLYTPGIDNINDTLFGLIGPAYDPGHPCETGDTNYIGRNVVLIGGFNTASSQWEYIYWYPQYFSIGYQLNFVLYPIIYEESSSATCSTTQMPTIRNGQQGFSTPYPNPATECINLNLSTPSSGILTARLYTTDGRLVQTWTRRVPQGESTVSLDLEVPATGSYLLQAQTAYGAATFWVNVIR